MTEQDDSRTPNDADNTDAPEAQESDLEVEHPENELPSITIDDLPPRAAEAARRVGWNKLMPVQAYASPYMLAERDVIVQSRTGSGKTGAFLLPIIARVETQRAECQALILVPTRELAVQVAQEAEALCGPDGEVRSVAVYGGVAYGPQIEAFQKGAHIVVGTPGRILDHLMKRTLDVSGIEMLVFDEADRMLSMGFYPDMREIRGYLPDKSGRNGYMFSATITPHVRRLAREFLDDPGFLSLSRDRIHVAETRHVCCAVPAMDKDRALVRLIEVENPASAIVFCNTKASVHYVATVLQRFGYDAAEISSDLNQNQREQVMKRLRSGTLRILVATDVAARGIDVTDLACVFQYEVPEDPESYVHRAGRTGRAGAVGLAITLAGGMDEIELMRIAKRFSIEFEKRTAPTDVEVAEVVSQRATALLEAKMRKRDKLEVERSRRFLPLVEALNENSDERMLLAMLLDDMMQSSLKRVEAPVSAETAAETPSAQNEDDKSNRRPRRGARRRRK